MDTNKVTTYGDIQLVAPYKIKTLTDLKIIKKINDHGTIFFTGIISEEEKASYIEMTDLKKEIEVNELENNSEVRTLFKGTVTHVEIKALRDIYYMEVEGISHSYEMDITLKSKSFQKSDMCYEDLVKKVISNYQGADFIDMASKGKKLEKFKMQYNETDWQFLKRMASNLNTALVVDCTSSKPKIWFGIPEGEDKGELDNFHYSIRKNISNYMNFAQNFIPDIEETDFIYFKVETDKYFNIGDKLKFKDKELYVSEITTFMEDSTLKYDYTLVSKNGLSQKLILNDELSGVSLEGKVVEVKANNVKVNLDVDKEQGNSDYCWFLYSTPYAGGGSGGWYCMPEAGDSVKLYFPSNKEEEAVVINSIRKKDKGGDKIDRPDVKYFRASSGKEAMFDGEGITFTAKEGVFIKLNGDGGIDITSDGDVSIQGGNLSMGAGSVQINADEKLELMCRASYIKMDGETHIRGSVVRIR